MNIEDRVRPLIINDLGLNDEKYRPDARLDEDLGYDSLDRMELMMAIEEEFGIEIRDKDVEKLETVQQVIDFIKDKMNQWTNRFLCMADFVGAWSKDPSTKVGAVIVDAQRRVMGVGYNGFARGVRGADKRYKLRRVKYKMVVHAELNAILNAQKTEGCILYTSFCPCTQCAAAIIQSGIKEVVYRPHVADERWARDQRLAKTMFLESKVMMTKVERPTIAELEAILADDKS